MTVIEYLAIIPARSGSKGIRNKNILKICNKECFRYTLEPLNSSNISKIFFSTDSYSYLNLYKKYCNPDKDITFDYLRSSTLASDISTADSYINECLEFLKTKGYFVKNFVILQPTSLFRTTEQINEVLDYHTKCNFENIKSVSKVIQTPYYMLYEDNKLIIQHKHKNRQEHKHIYIINGAYYVYSIENYNKNVQHFHKYLMSPLEGLDLDDDTDLTLITSLISRKL